MTSNVQLSAVFVEVARRCAKLENRSVSTQIEYWARIGKAVLDNPDLAPQMLIDAMQAEMEADAGYVTPYVFG